MRSEEEQGGCTGTKKVKSEEKQNVDGRVEPPTRSFYRQHSIHVR